MGQVTIQIYYKTESSEWHKTKKWPNQDQGSFLLPAGLSDLNLSTI